MSASVISLLCGVGEGWEFRSRTALGTKVTFLLWDLQLDSGVTQTMKTEHAMDHEGSYRQSSRSADRLVRTELSGGFQLFWSRH